MPPPDLPPDPAPMPDQSETESPAEPDGLATPKREASLVVDAPTPERDALVRDPSTLCLNCGQTLPGAFCPACGQKAQALRQPVFHFIRDAFLEFFGIDGRFWRTAGALLFKPGTLTKEYLAGRRQTYLRPLRVYLVSTLLFFFLLSLIDPVGRARETLLTIDASEDSVRVADLLADADTLLARGFATLSDERQDVAEAEGRVDSLARLASSMPSPDEGLEEDLREARDELAEARAELVEDSTSRAVRLRRTRVERAILATMPPDSLIDVEGVEGASRLVYPDSASFLTVNGEGWPLRNEAWSGISGAPTETQRRDNFVRFIRSAIGHVPAVLFLILPLFALLLKVLYARRDWFYSEHLIFGLHTHAYAFAVFSLFSLGVLVQSGLPEGGFRSAIGWLLILAVVSIPVYFFVAQKRVYGQGWIKTAVKAIVLASAYNVVLAFGLVAVVLLTAVLG